MPLNIEFRVQCQNIPAYEWLGLLTLCFAPFASHILVGMPPLVLTSGRAIPWHRRLNLLNPTTIAWRYLMTTDRRLRTRRRHWTPEAMAVASAVFWTAAGRWDGAAVRAPGYQGRLFRPPPAATTPLLSTPSLGVAVVTVQGLMAVYQAVAVAGTGHPLFDGVANVFVSLAIISLFRILPARWLTQDFNFRDYDDYDDDDDGGGGGGDDDKSLATPLLDCASPDLQSPWCPAAILLRGGFMLVLLAVFAAQALHIVAWFHATTSVSAVSEHLLYHSLITATITIFTFQLLRPDGDSTVLPCINSPWYTAYTILWYLAAVYVVVINGLETRRTSCGVYTTLPASAGLDAQLCAPYA